MERTAAITMKPKVTNAVGMIAGCAAANCVSMALLRNFTDARSQLSHEALAPVGVGTGRVENPRGAVEMIRGASDQIVVDEIAEAIGATVAAIRQAGMDLASDIAGDVSADALSRIAFEDLDRPPDLARCDVDDDLTKRVARNIGLDEGVTTVSVISQDEIQHTISDESHRAPPMETPLAELKFQVN
jgi:hypothetical protein